MAAGYIHTFSAAEQARLAAQAEFLEPYVFPTIDFSCCERVLEVGCGVGAELKILRRRFPQLHLTGLDHSEIQLAKAGEWLQEDLASERLALHAGSAYELPFAAGTFDGACLIWVLEHLLDPARALREVWRVLSPGGVLSVTEVCNSSWSVSPQCPAMIEYWRAFNEFQRQLGGNPDVGAQLGRLATQTRFGEIHHRSLPVRMDAAMKDLAQRRRFISYWESLWLSGAAGMQERGLISSALAETMQLEFASLVRNPEGSFNYTAYQVQARKTVL